MPVLSVTGIAKSHFDKVNPKGNDEAGFSRVLQRKVPPFIKSSRLNSMDVKAKNYGLEQAFGEENIHINTLADAVKLFIGVPNNIIDCYGLVVRGMTGRGVKYHGRGGVT